MKDGFCFFLFITCGLVSNIAIASHDEHEPPAQNTILSKEEIDAYLTGKSLGFEKVAEINHYPSPKRVLDMQDILDLNTPQKNRSTILLKLMRKYAIQSGRKIVQKEKQLARLFKQPAVDMKKVKKLVAEIAELKGEVRYAYLKAHIAQKEFLSEEQIATYIRHEDYKTPVVYAFDE